MMFHVPPLGELTFLPKTLEASEEKRNMGLLPEKVGIRNKNTQKVYGVYASA
jgi:hypothetical protein